MIGSGLNLLCGWQRWVRAIALLLVASFLTSCALPQVSAEERLFLPLSLEFLDVYQIPSSLEFDGMPVRGLSALAYDRERDRLYALSDDRGNVAPARFFTLQFVLDRSQPETASIEAIAVESATLLRTETGDLYPAGTIDPEGLALSPRDTVFIASEGDAEAGIPPFINEFNLETGERLNALPIPQRYLPAVEADSPQGVQNNKGFEALTISAAGRGVGRLEPFRVFAGIEERLQQDAPPTDADQPMGGRLLHYLVGEDQETLLAEHLYPIDPKPFGAVDNGLVELVVLDQGGHLLSMERSYGLAGVGVKLFQIAMGDATDTSQIEQFGEDTSGIQPIRKRLVLDLGDLGISLDNLEGMALGPLLPDRTPSLILVSDDNFSENQVTQVLLFRLRGLQGQ
ncbi:MAG: esterase-like activity of phytase family protein [Synechococcales bacterium]|nr:esterase-like activity of phytase family protein [Synechococcales bacterium]